MFFFSIFNELKELRNECVDSNVTNISNKKEKNRKVETGTTEQTEKILLEKRIGNKAKQSKQVL